MISPTYLKENGFSSTQDFFDSLISNRVEYPQTSIEMYQKLSKTQKLDFWNHVQSTTDDLEQTELESILEFEN